MIQAPCYKYWDCSWVVKLEMEHFVSFPNKVFKFPYVDEISFFSMRAINRT